MKVAIHQPDLLPYSGFWFKLATSDAFVIAQHDQFQKHGYQRRVGMRGSWVSHRLVGKPALIPITAVEVLPGWQQRLADAIRGRYSQAPHFRTRGLDLIERIQSAIGTSLVEVNLALIHIVAETLQITTPLVFTEPPTHHGVDRLIEQTLAVGGTSYLSGSGGAAYLGPDAAERFGSAGIRLEWSDHQADTGDSIVTVLLDRDRPLDSVLRRHD